MTPGTPASLVWVSGADVVTLAAPWDWDAKPGLPAEAAGLWSETAVCVAGAEDEAANADLETVSTDPPTDSQFWRSVMLKGFSWTSGEDGSGVPFVESTASPFK